MRGRDGLIAILYTMSRSIVITSDLAPCMSVTHLCTTCLYITSLSLCLSVCVCVSLSHQPPSLAAYITSLSSSSESHTTAASATRSNHHTHTHTHWHVAVDNGETVHGRSLSTSPKRLNHVDHNVLVAKLVSLHGLPMDL